jgi:predicted DNA-binding protein (UPF0251 family)
MNELLNPDGSSPDWEQLRPIIDDTLNELEVEDREAILLRYFQGCVLAEVGARLGIQENTARMRVDRALEKLRVSLARRKITSTAAVLANSLTGYAMSTAPTGLAAQVSQVAIAGTAAVAGGGTTGLLGGKVAKFLIAAAVVGVVVLSVSHHLLTVRAAYSQAHLPANPDPNNAVLTALSSPQNPGTQSNQAVDTIPLMEPRLDIYLDDPRTGKPVPGITIDERLWCKADFKTGQFYSDKNGWCEVTYPSNVTTLELTTRLEGYT